MPSDEPSRPYNWRLKSLAKLKLLKTFKLLVERYAEYYEKYNIYGGGLSHTSINNLKYENKANTHSYALRRTIMCRRRLGSL